jgi:hypothetical protein
MNKSGAYVGAKKRNNAVAFPVTEEKETERNR